MIFFSIKKGRGAWRALRLFFWLAATAAAQEPAADLIVANARVRTLDARRPRGEALAVRGGRIVAVGSDASVRRLAGPQTRIIDAGGRLVLPGFNDSHVHFLGIGSRFSSLDLRAARSAAEMTEKVEYYARFLPAGRWILGGGWDHRKWSPPVLPTKASLDRAAPAHPVFLYSADGQTALVNGAALAAARLDKAARDVFGADVERAPDGAPTGILRGAALRRVRSLAPASNAEDKSALLETASNYAAFYGVTSVQDMSADDNFEILSALARDGRLKTRVYECTNLLDRRRTERPAVGSAGSMVRTGCLKSFAEGGDEEIEPLYREVSAADRAGRQVMIHAIGGRAVANALGVFERVARENGRRDRRFRIEHAAHLAPATARSFARQRVVASFQPALFADAAGRGVDPLRSFLAAQAPFAFGSDASMIDLDPLAGIYAAVVNQNPVESLPVEAAVRAYTSGAAYAEFQEAEKGLLAPGQVADFVILSDDIFAVAPEAIRHAKVLTTVTDGRIVYQRK